MKSRSLNIRVKRSPQPLFSLTPPKSKRETSTILQVEKPRTKSSCYQKRQNYDKYYIHPELRYRKKGINPKKNSQNYQDDTFLYKNLHNREFWEWTHPLDVSKIKPIANPSPKKVYFNVLQRFRHYLEHKANKRVPLTIEDYLSQPSQPQ